MHNRTSMKTENCRVKQGNGHYQENGRIMQQEKSPRKEKCHTWRHKPAGRYVMKDAPAHCNYEKYID